MKRTGIDKTAYAAMILLLLFFMGVLYLRHSYAQVRDSSLLGGPAAVDRDLLLISTYQQLKDSELGRDLELLDYESENLEEAVRRKLSSAAPAPAAAEPARAETLRLTAHQVREGQSIWTIARTYGVSARAISTTNNLSSATQALTVGQVVKVPNADGMMITVRPGESLGTLAQRFHVSTARLMAFNQLRGASVRAGQRLYVPGSNLQAVAGPATGTGRTGEGPQVTATVPMRGTGGFINPLPSGRFSSGFGWRIHPVIRTRKFHNGVDLTAPQGTAIIAAREGRVQYAGWISGYGKTVVIEHENGMSTYYAHCSSLTVGNGAYVNQGQMIARVGATGIATGAHLHFEVRSGGAALDSAPFIGLSSRASAAASLVRTPTVVQQGRPQAAPSSAPTVEQDNTPAPAAPSRIDVEVVPAPAPSASPTVTGGGVSHEGAGHAAAAGGASG
ncbi:MAG TPA: M23 family metallopeptidase [bacterium]|nr:M23 family metallopeptidase [bacterium]